MRDLLISNRYAQALLDLSVEMDKLEETRQDIEAIIALCKDDKQFVNFLRSPVIMPEKKVKVLDNIFKGKVQDLTVNFIDLIALHRRENILDQIARQFIELYKKRKNIITTNLTTAVEISKETRDEVIGLMERYTKGNIDLHEQVDEDLIGGFVLTFEDKQFDSSLRNRINKLKKEFEQNPYIREI
jgi:F-type H+-transporting ATPase subunit delta